MNMHSIIFYVNHFLSSTPSPFLIVKDLYPIKCTLQEKNRGLSSPEREVWFDQLHVASKRLRVTSSSWPYGVCVLLLLRPGPWFSLRYYFN